MLTILVLALSLMVYGAKVSRAEPMGTAFTYQGRLMDANGPGDGLYDFEFMLYNAPSYGSQLEGTVEVNDLDVTDGYFTAELDFGSNVFNGDARWLEISVRPGDSNDPNAFVTLSPRQEVTATPYALQTRGMFVDDSGNVGIGTKFPNKKLTVAFGDFAVYPGQEASIITDGMNVKLGDPEGVRNQVFLEVDDLNEKFVLNNGNVGIGTSNPGSRLEIKAATAHSDGGLRITSSINSNRVITLQDATPGDQGQITVGAGGSDKIVLRANGNTYFNGGNVGIGTTNPSALLSVDSSGPYAYTALYVRATGPVNPLAAFFVDNPSGNNALRIWSASEFFPAVRIINEAGGGALEVHGNASLDGALEVHGNASVEVLKITGADVAEKFPVSEEVKPGIVVAIDPENPGKLCVARGAYNRCVAGVVSGAGDLPTGVVVGDLPGQEDAMPVALSGRVWVYCDANEQPIEPGNLLTTAKRPGYAMAVTDYTRAHGAVLGKAMTNLEKGQTGLVLTLINLQ